MKLSVSSLVILLISSADAFAPMHMASRTPTFLRMSVDTADAVKEAKEASEKFGATSPEARVAWELVEEIDAANSREKADKKAKDAAELAAEMAEVEPCAEPTVRNDNSEAVNNALEASKIYGKTSKEARLAWDIVEEVDSANSDHRSDNLLVKKEEECTTDEPDGSLDNGKQGLPKTVEEAIERASMMSKVYGKRSSDARMAWELVEEMDSASSHTKAIAAEKAAREAEAAKPKEEKKVLAVVYKDSTEAISAALEASKTHGATSIEARMAWELVEEIDSANSHHKTVGSG